MTVTDTPTSEKLPFPVDGVCPICGADYIMYSELVPEYRVVRFDDEGVIHLDYMGEHGDGFGIEEEVHCRNCFQGFEMPEEFEWD